MSSTPSYGEDEQSLVKLVNTCTSENGEQKSSWSRLTGPLLATLSNIEDASDNDDDDDVSTVRGEDFGVFERPKRLLQGDTRLEYPDCELQGNVLISPVKTANQNRSKLHQSRGLEVMTTDNTGNDEPLLTSTTSSFSNVARSTFGASYRRRGSVQSIKSPVKDAEALGGPTGGISTETEHTIVNLLPLSPITPRRSATIHTPSHLHFDELKVNTHLIVPIRKHDSEPLSATLRTLGARRGSLSDDEGEDSTDSIETQLAMQDMKQRMQVRLEHHNYVEELVKANQSALRESEDLFTMTDKKPAYSHIQSTTRGGQQPTPARSTLGRLSTILTNYIFGNLHNAREKLEVEKTPMDAVGSEDLTQPDQTLLKRKGKGDGWGGLRPRSSWFPESRLGPLMSPTRVLTPSHLRSFQLRTCTEPIVDDIWIDEEEIEEHSVGQVGVMEKPEESIKKLRVKFPSYMPKPSRDGRHLSNSSTGSNDSIVVKYTKTSAEGRPVSKRGIFKSLHVLRSYGGLLMALLLLVCMVAILAVVATSVIDRSKNHVNNTQDKQIISNDTLPYSAPVPASALPSAPVAVGSP